MQHWTSLTIKKMMLQNDTDESFLKTDILHLFILRALRWICFGFWNKSKVVCVIFWDFENKLWHQCHFQIHVIMHIYKCNPMHRLNLLCISAELQAYYLLVSFQWLSIIHQKTQWWRVQIEMKPSDVAVSSSEPPNITHLTLRMP